MQLFDSVILLYYSIIVFFTNKEIVKNNKNELNSSALSNLLSLCEVGRFVKLNLSDIQYLLSDIYIRYEYMFAKC